MTVRPEVDVDLVVAGAGGAGLAAALAAAQSGMSVAVLEWRENFRQANNTSMSTAMIPAAGTRWQQQAGIDDSAERFLDDVVGKTKGTADPVVSRSLVEIGPELVAWLADDCGLPLELVTEFTYPGHSRPRCHSMPDRAGSSLLRGLLAALERQPTADLVVPSRLREVDLGPDGAVIAAVTEDPSGARQRITTSALVMATGGFGADPALVAEHLPEIASGLYFGGDGCVGDALRIGQRLGADTAHLDAYQGHGSVAVPHGVLTTWATVMHGSVIINDDGQRFGDETTGYSEYARVVLDQPGGKAWLLLDERIDAACRPFKDHQDLVSQGAVRWAQDLTSLAKLIDVGPEVLGETIARAGESAARRVVDAFGRRDWEAPLVAPYGAIRITGALFHTQGGVRVSGNAEVLRDGVPVPGLYAAGGAAAGMSGDGASGYLAGNGLLAALGLGYRAGRAAALPHQDGRPG